MVDIFSTPSTQDVGQFGADNSNVERYKQAAEYAAEAKEWAEKAVGGVGTIENLQQITGQLQDRTEAQAKTIDQLGVAFTDQTVELSRMNQDTQAAAQAAHQAETNAISAASDAEAAAQVIQTMKVDAHTVEATVPADAVYDKATNTLHLGIPKGESGRIEDIANTPALPGAPDASTKIMVADTTQQKAYLADLGSLASLMSVTSVNGHNGTVVLTKNDVGLGNVENVASYSKTEADAAVSGFFKSYPTLTEANADIVNRKEGEVVVVYNYDSDPSHTIPTTKAQRDWYKVTNGQLVQWGNGENIVRTINGKLPNDQGELQISLPEGNPQLWLGEMVMFPYNPDPTKQVHYPGVLRADGGTHSVVGYSALINSFKDGTIPYVSFAEWDAGAKTVFGWDGNDTTGNFRTPDWTDGAAIRTPVIDNVNVAGQESSSETLGSVYEQVPYVVSINTFTPDEDTGDVYLRAEDVGALGGESFPIYDEFSLSDWAVVATNGLYSVPGRPADIPDAIGTANVEGILLNWASTNEDATVCTVVQELYTSTGAHYTRSGRYTIATQSIVWNNLSLNGGDTKGWAALDLRSYARSGANSDITALNALTTPLTTQQGGFGRSWTAGQEASVAPIRTALNLSPVATMNIGQTAGTVAAGNDNRFLTVGISAANVAAGNDIRFRNFLPADATTPANGSQVGKALFQGDIVLTQNTTPGTVVNSGSIDAAGSVSADTIVADKSVRVKKTDNASDNAVVLANPTTPVTAADQETGSLTFNYHADKAVVKATTADATTLASLDFGVNGNTVTLQANGVMVSPIDLTNDAEVTDANVPANAYVTRAWVTAHAGSGGGTGGGTTGGVSQDDFNNLASRVSSAETSISGLTTQASGFLTSADASTTYATITNAHAMELALIDLIARVAVLEAKATAGVTTPPSGESNPYNPIFAPTPAP